MTEGQTDRTNRHISALDVREALGLLDELLKLPDGLNTHLQTGGTPLSSSQAARLMLARAIVGRPRLLLIDGTLDRLPDDLMAEILEHLMAKDAPWTLLVTTGRRAVMAACQRVVALQPDLLDDQGDNGGRYRLKKV